MMVSESLVEVRAMSDYVCPNCGCGFTEKHGRKRVEAPWRSDVDSWLDRITYEMMDAFVCRTYHVIRCPNCEYIIGGDDNE